MKVFLLQDIARVGKAGEIVKVSDGYANNFVLPRKLGLRITHENEHIYLHRLKNQEKQKEYQQTATSQLSEKIEALKLVYKAKAHHDGKLYGSVGAQDIVDILAQEGIAISKSQVLLNKSIKEIGSHAITIKLSRALQPTFILKVISEK